MTTVEILERVKHIRNLNSPHTLAWLIDLARTCKTNQYLCEVGTYFGYVSSALALTGNRVITIDHMLGGFCDLPELTKFFYEDVVQNFKSTGAWPNIRPIVGRSLDALSFLNVMQPAIHLIYLDGDHSAKVVERELIEFSRFVPVGGYITGDDCTLLDNIEVLTEGATFNNYWNMGLENQFKHSRMSDYCEGVSVAVWNFFRNNPSYSPLPNVPLNQFGFQRIQ